MKVGGARPKVTSGASRRPSPRRQSGGGGGMVKAGGAAQGKGGRINIKA